MVFQNAKNNKDECIQLMELVYQVLLAIANLHIKSETPGSLPVSTMDHLRKFTEYMYSTSQYLLMTDELYRTIHKIHTFVEAQQEGNRLKNFFRRSEMNSLLKDCHGGLQKALELFKVRPIGLTVCPELTELIRLNLGLQLWPTSAKCKMRPTIFTGNCSSWFPTSRMEQLQIGPPRYNFFSLRCWTSLNSVGKLDVSHTEWLPTEVFDANSNSTIFNRDLLMLPPAPSPFQCYQDGHRYSMGVIQNSMRSPRSLSMNLQELQF